MHYNIKTQLKEDKKEYEIIEENEQISLSKDEMQRKFDKNLEMAKKLVDECGYHRRDEECLRLNLD
jgi:hypothetical protein